MSHKRNPENVNPVSSEDNGSDDKRRRLPTLKNVVLEVMRMQSVPQLLEPILEPFVRKVVKEEIELALKKHLTSMTRKIGKDVQSPESKNLKLQFLRTLSLPVFTGARIEGDDCCSLKVVLLDALNGEIVNSGPESSVRVEIVVLEGDFDEGDNWSIEEFNNNIVREREGKKFLLAGDAFCVLQGGTGSVGEISFTDNSSWTRSRRFRLGARVVGNSYGTRVREAKTEAFIVRDHRGELYKKHHPPSLSDEVWRLEKIGKDGAFHKRLSQENIITVKDFLTLHFIDASRLQNILGTGMSPKMWEVTMEHARACVLDKQIYLYCPSSVQQRSGVVFNVVGQLIGVLSESKYVRVDELSESEKAEAQNLVFTAFEHQGEVIPFDNEASLTNGSLHFANAPHVTSSAEETSNGSKILAPHRIAAFDYTPQQSVSSPDIMSSIFSFGDACSFNDLPMHNIDHLDSFTGQITNFRTEIFCNEDHLQFLNDDHSVDSQNSKASQADLHTAVNCFLLTRSVDKAQRRWTKLFSILKWFSIRRIVASKRTEVHDIQRFSRLL